jgi:[ribosomal protein S5]-alanine N-acetyltransferase
MIIQTERIYTRPFTENDRDNFFLLNGDEQIMKYIRQTKSQEESAKFLREVIRDYGLFPGLGRWAMIEKSSGRLIGMFSLLPFEQTKDVHIGYALLKNYWGHGYASEMVNAGLQYAYEVLKLPSLIALTHPENTASQKILLNNQFKYQGVFKAAGVEEFVYRHTPLAV